jgi:MoaA/NifB/PqqE/SkfB family radical SAM enzyme
VVLRRRDPIVGSLIVTDRCNLACQHCAVANLRRTDYPFASLCADMRRLREQGVRILFLYGGEPMLWRDGQRRLPDLIAEARTVGFAMVNVVTNGTRGLDLADADIVLVSLDGTRDHHDQIRGRTYDRVLDAVRAAPADNLTLYMAVNAVNIGDIEHVCRLARDLPHVRGVAFNLHTPYPGTEFLALSADQRREACESIIAMIDAGYPVVDLRSALPAIADGAAPGPCPQCVIVEDGQQWTCGRCVEIPGLCDQCGFLFASELTQLFRGDPRVVRDALQAARRAL